MKKAILSTLGVALLVGCLMGCSAQAKNPSNSEIAGSTPQSSAQPVYEAHYGGDDGSSSIGANRIKAFRSYEQFGLTYDAAKDILKYNEKLVRWFKDYYPVGDNGQAGNDFFNENGVVDVYAVRDLSSFVTAEDGSVDPSGKLTGLKEFSQKEFDDRNVETIKNPPILPAISGDLPTSGEMEKIATEYKDFGVTYDAKSNQWSFNGEKVRYFRDVMTTNGESLTSGKYSGSMRTLGNAIGTVDIYTVRDFTKSTADGVGTLTGVEKFSQQEFDKHTQDGKSTNAVMERCLSLVKAYGEQMYNAANCVSTDNSITLTFSAAAVSDSELETIRTETLQEAKTARVFRWNTGKLREGMNESEMARVSPPRSTPHPFSTSTLP